MAELAKGAKAAVNEAAGIGKDGAAAGDLKELKRCKEEALRLQAALTEERRKGLERGHGRQHRVAAAELGPRLIVDPG